MSVHSLLLTAALLLQGPLPPSPAPDSAGGVLTFEAFYAQVLANHPVARQAGLLEEQARAELLAARGGVWDPVLAAAWDRKAYGGKEYYNYLETGLKIPTPVGVDFKLGYENTSGSLINPDRTTPDDGLFIAAVTIPLARGIVSDQRRNAVAQAEALRDLAQGERAAVVNKLLFAAAKDYAAWYDAWRRQSIASGGVGLARFRLDAVRRRFESGDAAAIDTVEAGLEVRRRTVTKLEADAAYFAATQNLIAYLWGPQAEPVNLRPGVVPTLAGLEASPLDTTAVDGWLAVALRQHPDILKALAKLQQANANRRFFGQEILPEASIELAALAAPDQLNGPFSGWPDVADNYKFGLEGKTSLLLMSKRGKYDAASAKREAQELDLAQVQRDVRLAVLASANDVLTLQLILDQQAAAVAEARMLRDGEQRRFENGESTLFLVNARERTLLDEEMKLAGYQAKYAGARAALAVALGRPAVLPIGPPPE